MIFSPSFALNFYLFTLTWTKGSGGKFTWYCCKLWKKNYYCYIMIIFLDAGDIIATKKRWLHTNWQREKWLNDHYFKRWSPPRTLGVMVTPQDGGVKTWIFIVEQSTIIPLDAHFSLNSIDILHKFQCYPFWSLFP